MTTENKTEQDEELARQMVNDMIYRNPKLCKDEASIQMIKTAFELANDAHRGMRRKSGELYIYHPVAVARIAAEEIGLGPTSVTAALLHDVVEDTEMTLADLERIFNPKVAQIVDGLTKLENVMDQQESIQAENFRKLLISMIEDVRVILLKISDRLHNMRTLDSMPEHKRYRISAETLYIYAPVAYRLGLYAIKTELEDLSLKNEQPKVYAEIYNQLQVCKQNYETIIESVETPIRAALDKNGYVYEMKARTKSIYSIWKKMQNKGVQFDEIYDVIAMRIVFEPKEGLQEKTQCWDIYSRITEIFRPNPDRLRDWVSTPKSNGYEALHTTVMSPKGRWVEIQIRSKRMDEIAEKGLAAHWKYKGAKGDSEIDTWLEGLKKMLDTASQNSMEFLDAFKMNLFSQELMIFTPQGEMKSMPNGSTALDFAFEIHSSGDQVEIITSDNQKPKYEWINFCKTAKARTCIREAFKEERRAVIQEGEQMVQEELAKFKLSINARILRKMLTHYHFDNREDLYYAIGNKTVKIDDLEKNLRGRSANRFIKIWNLTFGNDHKEEDNQAGVSELPKGKNVVLSDDDKKQNYVIAPCCHPIPGDDVVAFVDETGKMHLHSRNCVHAIRLMSSRGDRIVAAQWESHKVMSFLVEIEISGIDRLGIVSEITGLIARQLHVKMRSVNFEAHDEIFVGNIFLYVYDAQDLQSLLEGLRGIKGIYNVIRKEHTNTEK